MIAAIRSWAATRSGRAVLAVVLVAELGVLAVATALGTGPFGDNDADIYLAAVRGWIDGHSLYAFVNAGGFGFTYPPFAAVLFAPLALVPASLGSAAFTVAAVAAAVATVRIVLTAQDRPEWGETLLLSCGLLVLYPVFREYASGQIDLALVLAVVVDVLLLPRTRYAGVLIGLAAAVKLTPAVFLLLLLVRMGPMAALRAVGAAVAATLVTWLVAPATSREYWTDRLWDTSNVGDQTAALNQSLAAVVARFADPADGRLSGGAALVWVVLVLAAVAAVAMWLWRTREHGPTVASLVVVAVLGLAISPVSWHHHWSWLVVLVPFLWVRAADSWAAFVLLLATPLASLPPWWVLGGYHAAHDVWTSWGNVVGSALLWWGLAVAALAVGVERRTHVPERAHAAGARDR